MFFKNVIHFSIFAIIIEVLNYVSCSTIRDLAADVKSNYTIPCKGLSKLSNVESVMWVFQGKGNKQISNHTIDSDGNLILTNLTTNDAGNYSCTADFNNGNSSQIVDDVRLFIRTVPPPLVNLTTHLSTILGLVFWDIAGDGGYPIIDFTAEYRAADPLYDNGSTILEDWKPISPNHISPNSRQIDVYHLIPNSSYWFRVWATNHLGSSVPVETISCTLYVDTDAELRRHFLTGVEGFDTRVWVAAVAVVMGTLCVLTIGTCLLLYRECRVPNEYDEDQDVMELVPNIILNPGFVDGQTRPELRNGLAPAAVVVCAGGKYSRANGCAEPRKV